MLLAGLILGLSIFIGSFRHCPIFGIRNIFGDRLIFRTRNIFGCQFIFRSCIIFLGSLSAGMDFCLHLGIGILQGLDPSGFDGFPGAGIESVRRLFVMFQRTAYGGGQKNQQCQGSSGGRTFAQRGASFLTAADSRVDCAGEDEQPARYFGRNLCDDQSKCCRSQEQ